MAGSLVRSLVDLRHASDTTLSEQVRSKVEWEFRRTYNNGMRGKQNAEGEVLGSYLVSRIRSYVDGFTVELSAGMSGRMRRGLDSGGGGTVSRRAATPHRSIEYGLTT